MLALAYFDRRETLVVTEKSALDYVTEADRAVEQKITELIKLKFPNDDIVGEEMGGASSNAYWIIDPIDGTSNFLSGIPFWGVSIAFVENGEPKFGAICMPALGKTVFGHMEEGLDSETHSQRSKAPKPRVFGVGRNGNWNATARIAAENQVEMAGYNPVNLGSCAVTLAYCALGNIAGYVESGIGFWDCAAGVVICRAAGLPVWFSDGGQSQRASIYCGPLVFDL